MSAPKVLGTKISTDGRKGTFSLRLDNLRDAVRLRRIIMNKVKTLAIDSIWFDENNTTYYDETVALAIMGNIVFDIKALGTIQEKDLHKKYSIEGDVKCFKTVDSVNVCSERVFYGRDLIVEDPIKVAFPDVILFRLRPGDSIKFRCHASFVDGSEHKRWSPVTTVTFAVNQKLEMGETILVDMIVESNGSLTPQQIMDRALELY